MTATPKKSRQGTLKPSVNEIAAKVLEMIGDRSPASINISVSGESFRLEIGGPAEPVAAIPQMAPGKVLTPRPPEVVVNNGPTRSLSDRVSQVASQSARESKRG